MNWSHALGEIVALPREKQLEALRRLHSEHSGTAEKWNTAFDGDSLYAAWTTIPLLQDLYRHNRTIIRPILDERASWHIIEIGGGNGALWRDFLHPDECGQFTLVDPDLGAHRAVASALPVGVAFDSIVAPVEEAQLPAADLVVCSLALHHIGKYDESIASYRKALGVDPNFVAIRRNHRARLALPPGPGPAPLQHSRRPSWSNGTLSRRRHQHLFPLHLPN